MRKTRVLAALLCLMMIATAIPMMQASAAETDAGLAAVLAGATEKYKVDFTKYYTASNVTYKDTAGKHVAKDAEIYHAGAELARLSDGEGGTATDLSCIKAGGSGLFCRDEMFLADNSLTSKQTEGNNRLDRVDVIAEGLAVRAGNKADSTSDNVIPGQTGPNFGWKWDDTNTEDNYHLADGKLDVNMGYAGAMLFKLKLDKEGSSAEVLLRDGANGETQVGFVVSNAGIKMKYASNYAYGDAETTTAYDQYAGDTCVVSGPQFITGDWYEVLLKNNFNRYTIYVRKEGEANFTKVVTGTAKYGNITPSAMKQLMMYSLYNTVGLRDTKLVTINGATKQYLASYVEEQGWVAGQGDVTAITDGNKTIPLSQVTFESVTTYEDSDNSGMTLQEALGQNAVATAKYEASTDNAALISGGMALTNWGLGGSATTNGGDVIVEKSKNINTALSALTVDTAIEFGVKIPENAGGAINLRGNTNISNTRLYADIGGAGVERGTVNLGAKTNPMLIKNLRNIATDARTFLLTIDNTDGTNYMKLWAKHPVSGKYLYLGKTVMKDSNGSSWPRLENNGSDAAYTITSMAVYNKNGLAESAVLPEGAEDLYKYVNADMDTQPSNFETERAGTPETRGELAFVKGILNIKLPTASTGDYTYLKTTNAFIPKGGYAEVGFKTYPHKEFRFETRDGAKHFFVALKPNSITATNSTTVTGTVNGGYNMDPNTWMDMRIVRSAEDKFSVYLKKAGENGWTRVVTDAAPSDNDRPPLMQIGGYGTATSNRDTDAHYLDYLYVYGPKADQPMVVLDGKRNEYVTLTPAQGATLTRGAQAVIAPGTAGTLIFAGYDKDSKKLIAAEPFTVTSKDVEQVFAPTTLTSSDIDTIKVFLWSDFEDMDLVAPMQSFAK